MILPNRPFERVAPSREARSIYIFCEGVRREFDYFNYFVELDSRINVEVYKLHPHDDNSPLGLLRIAEKCILGDNENGRDSLSPVHHLFTSICCFKQIHDGNGDSH